MSMFGNILQKLVFSKPAPEAGASPAPQTPPRSAAPHPADQLHAASRGEPDRPAGPRPMSEVDVVGKMEGLAASNPQELNWKVSIVDLLKLLDLDSSYEARKELLLSWGARPTRWMTRPR